MKNKVEKYLEDYTNYCSNELSEVTYSDGRKEVSYHEWISPDHGRAIAAIAREEVIEKAAKWIKDSHLHYPNTDIPTTDVVKNFKRFFKS